jgi:4-amino-4-deoxy-L-arabinose transferase-like glycosyltransferase
MFRIRSPQALAFMVLCLLVAAALRVPNLLSIPPGLHYDEAANVVLAAEIGIEGKRPVFISSYTGKEVFFFYLAGGIMRLIGPSVFGLRLTAAFIGILTVAAVYWLGVEALRDRRMGMLAATFVAISFWHLLFSRLGFRAISQPLLQSIALAAILRGLKTNRWLWFLAAGAALGAAAYTYLAARIFPILILLAVLPLFINRKERWVRGQQLMITAVTATFILIPLLTYFVQNPDAFWVRIGQVAPGTEGLSLSESIWLSLQMFFWKGDPYIRFNIPGKPLFGWLWGGFMLFGWLFLLWQLLRTKRPLPDHSRFSILLLLLAPFIMILPTALATNEIVPSNLRAIGMIPFLFYLPAYGLVLILDGAAKRWSSLRPFPLYWTLILLTLGIGLLQTSQTYFGEWAPRADLFLESDADLAAAAAFLNELDTTGKTIYVSALHYRHPTVAVISSQYDRVKWLPQGLAIPFPTDSVAIYLFPQNSPAPEWAVPYLETAVWQQSGPLIDGEPAFMAYELDEPPLISLANPTNINFGNAITLEGYDVADLSESVQILLYWRVNGRPAANFTPFVHLEDQWGHRWSQVETFAYPAEQWRVGEWIIQQVDIPLLPGTPPGDYRLKVGLFEAAGGTMLPRLDENGRYAGSTFNIDSVSLNTTALPTTLPQPPVIINELVASGLQLLGIERGAATAATGEPFGMAFWWVAAQPVADYLLQVQLVQDGVAHELLTAVPVHDTYPFTAWQPNQFVIDRQETIVPSDLEPGIYALQFHLLDETGEAIYTADFGKMTVTATERSFVTPLVETESDAIFGGEIRLLGYTRTPSDNKDFFLELVWQAETAPAVDYTIFVHWLTVDGRCEPCIWQQDTIPRQGQYPTTRWLAGEVIIDTFQMTPPSHLPPGTYPVEIGWYIAETGQRLQVVQPDGSTGDALLLRPLNIPTP